MLVVPLPVRGIGYRRLGVGAAVAGGALIFLEGYLSLVPGFVGLAQFALFSGASIVALAIVSDLRSGHQVPLGALIVLLSVTSFLGLSGFLLGSLLGSLGGSLLVLSPNFSSRFSREKPTFATADLGPLCRTCGKHVPPWTSTCPYCSSSTEG